MKTFSCGCKFETDDAGKVIFNPDITKLDLECPAAWDLVCEGNTIEAGEAQKHRRVV